MKIDLSFDSVCKLVKNEYPEIANDIDAFSNIIMAISVAAVGTPIAVAMSSNTTNIPSTAVIVLTAINTLSSLFTVKNEFPKITKRIIEKVTSKRDKDSLEQLKRMEQAYYLICYTAFFETLGHEELITQLLKKAKLTHEEKLLLVKSASEKLGGISNTIIENFAESNDLALLNFPIGLPHPIDTFEYQREQLYPLYEQLSNGIIHFLKYAGIWDKVEQVEREKIEEALEKLPEKTLTCFQSQYYLLASKYEEFYVWSNLQEHEKTRNSLKKMSEFTQKYATLAETTQKTVDTGFKNLAEAIGHIPEQIEKTQANSTLKNLENSYRNALNTPIIKDISIDDSKSSLIYPKRSQAFIPQSFQVLRYTKNKLLENEDTWNGLTERNDLGAFLLSYLSHPCSFRTPLIILGQPGSGKSLLTIMLAARLISPSFTPIRVELRKVNADADITLQIKEQISNDTTRQIDWITLADHFENRPALVILDGYDELLQATGNIFASYLKKVQDFQERELANERQPVRTIVTSRISLIDKALIPEDTIIIRLLEFDPERQNKWIYLWNSVNATYFQQNRTKPFALPKNNKKINELAKQPLLLMMLALYDATGNQLHDAHALDQTLLYDNLLRQFIKRELRKKQQFQSITQTELDKAASVEMERLGVAALGMFNRRSLSIQAEELNSDLKFFNLEREVRNTEAGYLLSQAELLFGSFFFIHESISGSKIQEIEYQDPQERGSNTAYEFLHNTFGEFLTADFILRKILKETNIVYQLKKNEDLQELLSTQTKQFNGLKPTWFACFIYASLASRPVIVTLMQEWLIHCLQQSKRDKKEFLESLDNIVTNHVRLVLTGNTLPSLMTGDQHPFINLPSTAYIAIYTLNLILLRTFLSPQGYIFDETLYFSHIKGARPWDRLTHLWRSWFSLETLNEVAAMLTSRREGTNIYLKIKDSFGTSASNNRLALIHNISQALADNVTSGLSGLLLHDSWHVDKNEIDDISDKLLSEQIDLKVEMLTKQLQYLRRENVASPHQISQLKVILSKAGDIFRKEQYLYNSEALISFMTEVNKIALTRNIGILQVCQEYLPAIPDQLLNDDLALECLKLARYTEHGPALKYYGDSYAEPPNRTLSLPLIIELCKISREISPLYVPEYIIDSFKKMEDAHNDISIAFLVEIIRLARHFSEKKLLYYLYHFHINKISTIKEIEKYMHADLAIELIKIARELGDEDALPNFIRYLTKRPTRPNRYEYIKDIPDELIIEMIDFAREIGNKEKLSDIYFICMDLVRESRFISTELIIELIKIEQIIDNQNSTKVLIEYIKSLIKNDKHVSTRAIAGIIKYVSRVNHLELQGYFSGNYLKVMLQAQKLVPIELAIELIKLAQKVGTYNQASIESFYYKNITVDRCYLGEVSLDVIGDILGLAKEFHDNNIISKIDQKLGIDLR